MGRWRDAGGTQCSAEREREAARGLAVQCVRGQVSVSGRDASSARRNVVEKAWRGVQRRQIAKLPNCPNCQLARLQFRLLPRLVAGSSLPAQRLHLPSSSEWAASPNSRRRPLRPSAIDAARDELTVRARPAFRLSGNPAPRLLGATHPNINTKTSARRHQQHLRPMHSSTAFTLRHSAPAAP
ncbi:hypothetical protein P154DRAFT_20899 [Amniculicola lignicola CBS 123094]|uniref:Uncharacterized protein n=1 Tax=Amniculicola lignicola CBS 123094 TaxID=1392246 RepID=A0A6A5WT39_9PLEO|nr:hypothetical protein P154DRAFT_20899 [Amniculicola lignicola CBS 123094]